MAGWYSPLSDQSVQRGTEGGGRGRGRGRRRRERRREAAEGEAEGGGGGGGGARPVLQAGGGARHRVVGRPSPGARSRHGPCGIYRHKLGPFGGSGRLCWRFQHQRLILSGGGVIAR